MKVGTHPPFLVSKLLLKAFENDLELARRILGDMKLLETQGQFSDFGAIYSDVINESFKTNDIVIQRVLTTRKEFVGGVDLPLASEAGALKGREQQVDPRLMVYFAETDAKYQRRKENLLSFVDPRLYQEQLSLETEATDIAVAKYRKLRETIEKGLRKGTSSFVCTTTTTTTTTTSSPPHYHYHYYYH
jgi:hypothetical protein